MLHLQKMGWATFNVFNVKQSSLEWITAESSLIMSFPNIPTKLCSPCKKKNCNGCYFPLIMSKYTWWDTLISFLTALAANEFWSVCGLITKIGFLLLSLSANICNVCPFHAFKVKKVWYLLQEFYYQKVNIISFTFSSDLI